MEAQVAPAMAAQTAVELAQIIPVVAAAMAAGMVSFPQKRLMAKEI